MADQPLNTPLPTDNSAAGPILQTLAGPPQPTPVSGRQKEVVRPTTETPVTPEVPGQPAELEPAAEVSPEMDKFIERVEEQRVRPAAETVVVQPTPQPIPPTVSQPVVILPANQKTINAGSHKGMNFSVRWLAEWCWRQIRKFKNILVVYRENP